MPSTPKFDDALAAVVGAVVSAIGIDPVATGFCRFLQDAAGVITTIVDDRFPTELRSKLARSIVSIESYVDPTWPVGTANDLFDASLNDLANFREVKFLINDVRFVAWLADRRIVGYDWLVPALDPAQGVPPIISFASLKGGVGRSTALSIVAQDLSLQGLRVLAVDLDLEAPGLGSMLLPEENRPRFGSLDYYVERGPSAFVGQDFSTIMEASPIFRGGAPVYVVPAFGTASLENPTNVLGKLSRAYNEDVAVEGGARTFLHRTRDLIEGLVSTKAFDVVLVDSRAGLHESAAAPLLGIGADILLFGVNQAQTFEGYRPLLSHFKNVTGNSEALLPRIRMVHSKVNLANADEVSSFIDRSHRLFSETLYDAPEQTAYEFEHGEGIWYNISDPDGPHYPWHVAESTNFRLFDPLTNPLQLDAGTYLDPYAELITNVRENVMARLENVSE